MGGWTDAVNGRLYATVGNRKTHANMGNLFGWIFRRKADDFRTKSGISIERMRLKSMKIRIELSKDGWKIHST
jgi:hypothetical protein